MLEGLLGRRVDGRDKPRHDDQGLYMPKILSTGMVIFPGQPWMRSSSTR